MLNVALPLDCQLCHEEHKCRLVSSSEESDGTMDDISSFTGESYSSSFSTFSSGSEEDLSVTGTESSRGSDDERHFGIRAIRLKSPQTGFDGNAVSEWILIDSKSKAGNSNFETSEDGSVSDDLSRTGELESTTCSSSLSSEWPLFEVIGNKEDVRSCSTARSNSSISTDTESLPYSPVYSEVEDQGSSGNDTPSEEKIEVIFKKLGVSSGPSDEKPSGETPRQFPKRHGWVPRHQGGFPRPGFQHPHLGFPRPPNGFHRPQGGFPGYPPRRYPPHPSFPPRQPPFFPKFMPHPPPNSAPRDFFPERRFSEFQKPHPKTFAPKQFSNAPTPKFQQPSPPNVNVPHKPYLSKPPAPQTLAAQPEPPKEAALSAGLPPGHVLVPMYCNQDPQGSLRYTPLGYVDPVRQDVMSIPCVCMKIEEFLKMAYSPETPYERISRSEITRVGV